MPDRVRTHDVTKQVEYIGDVQNLVEKLSDLPAGGQVLMGPLTYQRIYSRLEEFRIHSLQKSYEQPARLNLCPLLPCCSAPNYSQSINHYTGTLYHTYLSSPAATVSPTMQTLASHLYIQVDEVVSESQSLSRFVSLYHQLCTR